MISFIGVALATALIAADASLLSFKSVDRTTAQRIAKYNYPVEAHNVITSDGYNLTVFRIPYSPRLQNQNEHRPVALLQHGILASSDCWILNGPNDALAYLLADSGYDVWLSNARGNTYSRKHVTLSTWQPSFWDFSFHEIGTHDLPAVIDYALNTTNESALHYVGHSMGTTVFFVLMSVRPEFNAKIKTAHMLAPVAYVDHMKSPATIVIAPLISYPSLISDVLGNTEMLPKNNLLAKIGSEVCAETSPFQPLCVAVVNFIAGWNSTHLNKTLLPDVLETQPTGISTKAFMHYAQEYESGYFRWFDNGFLINHLKYNQASPPNYVVKNIAAPVRLYYSDNDYFADVVDVKKIEGVLPNLVESFHVPYSDWNHLDFIYGLEVKATLYDRIINATNHFEETGNQLAI